MSIEQVRRLVCDGDCGAHIDGATAAEARKEAAYEGWQFPFKVKANGRPSSRSSDVCPVCAPTFAREASPSTNQWEGQSAEERRIRTLLYTAWRVMNETQKRDLKDQLAAFEQERATP